MHRSIRSGSFGICWCGVVLVSGCGQHDDTPAVNGAGGASNAGGSSAAAGTVSSGGTGGTGAGVGSGGTSSGGAAASGGSAGALPGAGGAPAGSGGADAGSADPCGTALFCDRFDDYAGVSTIADKQKFGPWRAALATGATMRLDGAHTRSGASALHVHIDDKVTAGGRLFADGAQPLFATKPTHVYGRMMMYIEPNGTSIHWTFFGVNGDAEASSPAVGRNAQYILSSLPRAGVNTYSFVYGLQAQGADKYHDCSTQSTTPMPSTWACISFDMDSVTRKLRMYKDGAATPIVSVDDHGKGCVDPTPVESPWYGPAVTQLFVGAWSFHEMNAPLDVWVDDLVVDTQPVSCPLP